MSEQTEYGDIKLDVGAEIKYLLEERLILLEDLQRVIGYAERTGNKFVNSQTGRFLAHFRPVSVTYWVEYAPLEDGFRVYNAYAYRMQIAGEGQS